MGFSSSGKRKRGKRSSPKGKSDPKGKNPKRKTCALRKARKWKAGSDEVRGVGCVKSSIMVVCANSTLLYIEIRA